MPAMDAARTEPVERAIVFAGVILLLIGVLSVIQGIAALAHSSALVDSPDLIVFGSSTWGTTLVLLGAAADLIALSLWIGAAARWIGVGIAAANGLVQILFLPAYPFWATAVFALDVLAILALFGLVANARSSGPRMTATIERRSP
jgi:hypothetical protein